MPAQIHGLVEKDGMFKGKHLSMDRDTDGAVLLRLDPVGGNKPFCLPLLWEEMGRALDLLHGEGRSPLLLIQGSKRGFLSGWSPEWLAQDRLDKVWPAANETMRSVLQKLVNLPIPSIAVIHGPCLGEGLELALAADYRIAWDQPKLQLGFLVDERGLVPEGDMLVRLASLVGLEHAANLVSGGQWLGGQQANAWGLVDGLAKDDATLKGLIHLTMGQAISRGKRVLSGLPLRGWRQKIWESHPPGRALLRRAIERRVSARSMEDAPAPREALALLSPNKGQLASELNHKLFTGFAPKQLLAFQATYERWQQTRPAKVTVRGMVLLASESPAAIRMLARHAQKGGEGCFADSLLKNATPEALGRVTLGLKMALPKRQAAKALARIGQTGPTGDASLILGTEPLHPGSSTPLLAFNEALDPENFTPAIRAGTVQLGERPPFVLCEDKSQAAATAAWLESTGSMVRFVPSGKELLCGMLAWVLWDEIIHLAVMGLDPLAQEADWKRFGIRPGPLETLDHQGLAFAKQMEQSWRATRLGITLSFATELLEGGFGGWPGRKGFLIRLAGRHVANALAVNRVRQSYQATNPASDPLWQALAKAAKLREARERVLLRLASAAATLLDGSGLQEAEFDAITVAGLGWPAHRPGILAWARTRGWKSVNEGLNRLATLGANRYLPSREAKLLAGGG